VSDEHELRTGAPDEQAWEGLAGGTWAGPVRVSDGDAEYAGVVRLVDVDEDERRASVHAQVRRLGGWGGVAMTLDVRAAGPHAGALAITGDTALSGDATPAVAERLAQELGNRLAIAVRRLDRSPADDPAWRRKLALRAALAVGMGVAAGLAGAAWDRRRRG
jgi:hypothetical protein